MDPIAALGAETPRLDSGMNPYCRLDDGRFVFRELEQSEQIMRYSAASFPGPTNSFIPDSEKSPKNKQRYGEPAMPDPAQTTTDQPSLEDAIGQAVTSLIPTIVQSVMQAMNGGDDMSAKEPSMPEEAGVAPTNPATVPRGEPESSATEEPVASPIPESPKPPGDDEEARYKAQGPAIYGAYCAGKKSSMNYSRPVIDTSIHKRLATLEAAYRSTKEELANERQDAMRYARLNQLSREHSFDPKDEMQTVIDMTPEQFERHCTVTIGRYAKRDDITNLQLFEDPTVEVDQYGRGSANEPSADDCYRYSREAEDIAAKKNFAAKKTVTNWATEYDALIAKHYPNAAAS